MRASRSLVAWASLAAALLGAAPPAAAAVVVEDDVGRTLRLPGPPAAVVSLAPSHTETLYALGQGDRLVAVNEWSDYPPEARAKPRLRGIRPSLEQLIALQPDLVLAVGGMGDFVSHLEAYGMPVLVLAPRNLEGAYRNIELLGEVTGAAARGRALTAAMRDRVAGVRARVAGARRPRVFYEVDGVNPVRPFTVGRGSFIHELLELAGGENVAADVPGAWPQLGLEQLLKMDPEVIILGDAVSVNNPQTLERVRRRPGWERITAIRRGAVYVVDGALVSRPGPRVVEGLEALARLLHPDRFPSGRPGMGDAGGPRAGGTPPGATR